MRAALAPLLVQLILTTILYLGILLNLSLLDLRAQQETIINTSSLIALVILLIIGIIVNVQRAKKSYLFFQSQIQFGTQQLSYAAITNTAPQQNILDKILKTYSIKLAPDFSLQNIPQGIQIQPYLEQMRAYARRATPSSLMSL
ncbi:hypothetical protein HYX14_05890 [Candidatus Woesearchaeota archaeon]|nr:hypothetical protein [Candidatus Woesearchaeota archaeon]